jgi:hypothetical protein
VFRTVTGVASTLQIVGNKRRVSNFVQRGNKKRVTNNNKKLLSDFCFRKAYNDLNLEWAVRNRTLHIILENTLVLIKVSTSFGKIF